MILISNAVILAYVEKSVPLGKHTTLFRNELLGIPFIVKSPNISLEVAIEQQ